MVISNIFYFHPEPWGNDPIWRAYFSNGLVQPPTSTYLCVYVKMYRWCIAARWNEKWKTHHPIRLEHLGSMNLESCWFGGATEEHWKTRFTRSMQWKRWGELGTNHNFWLNIADYIVDMSRFALIKLWFEEWKCWHGRDCAYQSGVNVRFFKQKSMITDELAEGSPEILTWNTCQLRLCHVCEK